MKNFAYLAAISLAVVSQAASAQNYKLDILVQKITTHNAQNPREQAWVLHTKKGDFETNMKTNVTVGGTVTSAASIKAGMNCDVTVENGHIVTSAIC
jgi:hypothetical protein